MSLTSKPYGLRLLDGLFDDRIDARRSVLKAAIKKRGDLTGYVPAFFFRHPVYASALKDRESIIFDQYSFSVTGAPFRVEDAEKLDRIFANATYDSEREEIVFLGEGETLISLLGQDWRVFVEGYVRSHIIISHSRDRVTFPLFDSCRVVLNDRGEEHLRVVFSRAIQYYYAYDYLVEYRQFARVYYRIREMEREKGRTWAYPCSHLIRYLYSVTTPPKNGLLLHTNLFNKIGFGFLSPQDQYRFPECILNARGLAQDLKQAGIGLTQNRAQDSTGKVRVDFTAAYPRPVRPEIFVNKVMDYHKEDSGKKRDDKYVVFSTLDIDDRFINIGKEFHLDNEEIHQLFKLFCLRYAEREKKYTVSRIGTTWRTFLKNQIGVSSSPVPNVGDPSNIVWNDDMVTVWTDQGLSNDAEAEKAFNRFKNYYVSIGKSRKNWVAAWMNWVLQNKESGGKGVQKTNTFSGGGGQNLHHIRRRVSAMIVELLREKDMTPEMVIEGQVHVKEIQYDSYIIPPGMGKGRETLFFFSDPDLQTSAEAQIRNEGVSPPPPAAMHKESEVVDTDIVGIESKEEDTHHGKSA